MTIEQGRGDLFTADAEALVNPVNTVGVMGKGLALAFKKAFPDNYAAYADACRDGALVPGRVHVFERNGSPRFIINFATKKHFRSPSRLEYVREGLVDLVARVRERRIRSIAIPALGCGLGGLPWAEVEPLIVGAFESASNVRAIVFPPVG